MSHDDRDYWVRRFIARARAAGGRLSGYVCACGAWQVWGDAHSCFAGAQPVERIELSIERVPVRESASA